MNVFFKYLFKSTLCKKWRSLLLIITITISAALLIGSIGAVKSGNKVSEEQAKKSSGDYDVVITANKTSETPFFSKNKISKSDFQSFITIISADGYLSKDDNVNINIEGVEPTDYKKLPNIKILKEDDLKPLTGEKIIISEKISTAYNFKLGDTVKINIRGQEKSFEISAIAETSGEFSLDLKNQFTIVVNEKIVNSIFKVQGLSSSMLVKLKNNIDSNKFIKNFNEKNSNCSASLTFDRAKANSDAESVAMLFYFMLLIVVFMSSFIIYSCFKLIIIERMPVIGTFLSQGETRSGIIKLLLGESVIYGIISGILAMFLGTGFLYVLGDLQNNYKVYGVPTKVDYNISYFAAGFIFAIGISLISALIPILATRKLQIKDIILNKTNVTQKKHYKLNIFATVLVLMAIVINSLNNAISVKFSPIVFFLFIIGTIILLPTVIKKIGYPLMRLLENINILFKLALNNIITSKLLLNNIRLVVIGMISIMIILSLSTSYMNAVIGMAKDYSEDISVSQGTNPCKIDSIISNNRDVKEVITTYFVGDGQIKGTEMKIAIGGINPETYENFNNYFGINNKKEFYSKLNKEEKNMAINDVAAKSLNKSIGDYAVLKVNNIESKYKITGVFNAKLSPNQILINKENMIRDFKVTVPDSYALKISGNPNEFKKSLEKQLKGTAAKVTTFEEDVKKITDDIKLIMNILLFFSFMTIVTGMFGVINNMGVSFIQRKKELAVLSSLGMTSTGNCIMLLIEGIFSAIFAIGLGGIISYFAVALSNNLVKLIHLPIPIEYDFKSFSMISIGIIIIMILSSCPALFKSSKLSVVTEFKYE